MGFGSGIEDLFSHLNDCLGASDKDEGDWDPFEPSEEDILREMEEAYFEKKLEQHIREHEAELEKQVPATVPECEKRGNAYRPDLDNAKIKELRDRGYSLRKIANALGASPSTIRNRLLTLDS